MAYRIEKETGDIVIDGFEQGIAASPHKGIANIQNANISTGLGEVISQFARVQDTMTSSATGTGTLAYLSTDHVTLSIPNSNNLFKGQWITVTNSSNTGQLPNGTYYVPLSAGAGFELSNYYNILNSTYSLPQSASYLIAGGGGGGGGAGANNAPGAGGGAGGLQTGTVSLTAQSYAITVGTGGAGGGAAAKGTNGGDSTAFALTSFGGGGGGNGGAAASGGSNGGSGGGGGSSAQPGGNGTGGQGNNGGAAAVGGGAGGGGGSSAVGAAGSGNNGGNGGDGTSSSISGAAVTYAAGGGGGATLGNTAGAGGAGGGGAGGVGTVGNPATGIGSGGGGGAGAGHSGGVGSTGTVEISYPIGSIVGATGGIVTYVGGNQIHTFTSNGTFTVPAPLPTRPTILSGFTAGLTATIQLVTVMGKPIASATETYYQSGTAYNRYYVLDNLNLVWVYDTYNETLYSPSDNVNWFLPDFHTDWCTTASGISVISGWLCASTTTGMFGKPTVKLGNTNSSATTWVQFHDFTLWEGGSQSNPHFCFTGHQGRLYVTDGNYIDEIFPDSTIADTSATQDNIQTICSWVIGAIYTEGTPTTISGSSVSTSDGKRLPVVFFTTNDGTLPTSITADTVYYLSGNAAEFNVYSASTGGSELDIQTGASGTQYFATFYPTATASAYDGSTPTYVLSAQRVVLPNFEVAQCMTEIGNILIIGCKGNILYPWDQIQNLPQTIITLPEANTQTIITVNQMAYVFPGNKGNIYITDGNVASAVTSVPDYCAGVPGIPSSYIEPYFIWGAAMYLRGRVYFSILDQTATKAGNCGGIWSFIPTQNLYIGQDIGIGLRLENQSSYGNYNGVATVLIPKLNQQAIAPQYFSGWESSVTSALYGIDATGTGTASTSTFVVETDAIPTGTMLTKRTFEQIEFKVSTPLLVTDSVLLYYRKNLTDAWTSCGTTRFENNRLSGYVPANFEKTQWTQLQAIGVSGSGTSFIRFTELRLR